MRVIPLRLGARLRDVDRFAHICTAAGVIALGRGTRRGVPGPRFSVVATVRLGHRHFARRTCSGLAQRIYSTVRTVITFGVLADFRPGRASRNRTSAAVVGCHVAPGFLGSVSQGFGQAALPAARTVVTLDVLAFLVLGVPASLHASLTVGPFDVPAPELLIFWFHVRGRLVRGQFGVAAVCHDPALQRRIHASNPAQFKSSQGHCTTTEGSGLRPPAFGWPGCQVWAAGAVVLRTTRRGASTSVRGGREGSAMRARRNSAARMPTSRLTGSTVVRETWRIPAR